MVKLCVNFSLTALLSARFFVDNEIIPYLLFGLFRPNVDIFRCPLIFYSQPQSTDPAKVHPADPFDSQTSESLPCEFIRRPTWCCLFAYIYITAQQWVGSHSFEIRNSDWMTWVDMEYEPFVNSIASFTLFAFYFSSREERRKMVCVLERRQHGRWGCQNFNHFQIILSMCFGASRAFQKKKRRESFRSFFCSVEILNSILNSTRHVEWTEQEEKNSRESSWTAAII